MSSSSQNSFCVFCTHLKVGDGDLRRWPEYRALRRCPLGEDGIGRRCATVGTSATIFGLDAVSIVPGYLLPDGRRHQDVHVQFQQFCVRNRSVPGALTTEPVASHGASTSRRTHRPPVVMQTPPNTSLMATTKTTEFAEYACNMLTHVAEALNPPPWPLRSKFKY